MGSPTISSLLAVHIHRRTLSPATIALIVLLVLNGFFVISNARPAPAKPMVLWLPGPLHSVNGPIKDMEAFPAKMKRRFRVLWATYEFPSPRSPRPFRPRSPPRSWDSGGGRTWRWFKRLYCWLVDSVSYLFCESSRIGLVFNFSVMLYTIDMSSLQ